MEGLWIVGGRAAVSSVRLIGRPPARPCAGEWWRAHGRRQAPPQAPRKGFWSVAVRNNWCKLIKWATIITKLPLFVENYLFLRSKDENYYDGRNLKFLSSTITNLIFRRNTSTKLVAGTSCEEVLLITPKYTCLLLEGGTSMLPFGFWSPREKKEKKIKQCLPLRQYSGTITLCISERWR